MICRLWRGWTSPENADEYERIVRAEVIPEIEARNIPGFRHIDLIRRDLGGEIEFQTLMWFDSLEAIKAFMGEDYSRQPCPARSPRGAQQLRRPRRPLRSHRPPRTITEPPELSMRAHGSSLPCAGQPPDSYRLSLIRLGAGRARTRLRSAVRRERRRQDQPARGGVDARAGARPARRALSEMARQGGHGGWAVAAKARRCPTSARARWPQRRERRQVRINGAPASVNCALRMAVDPVADAGDGPAVHRQRRRATALPRPPRARAGAEPRAPRARATKPRCAPGTNCSPRSSWDEAWLASLEAAMAEHGAAIAEARSRDGRRAR